MSSALLSAAAQSPHGPELKIDCARCHEPSGWNTIAHDLKFDHATTDFPLEGAHGGVDCRSCHGTLIFSEASTHCNDCHSDVHAMTVGIDCARCHTTTTWMVNNIPELHEQAGFALLGAHNGLNCSQCHVAATALRFEPIGNDCDACHLSEYTATTDPNHGAAGFSTDCATCHDPNGWTPSSFDHASATGFALNGSHTGVDCNQCHSGGYAGTPSSCEGCHLSDYTAAATPNHVDAGFPTDCAMCHDETAWGNATFDHNTTGFPLTGQHVNADCAQCHSGGYAGTPTSCDACHLSEYTATTDPNHGAAGFSTDCATCHDPNGWTPSSFDHASATGFALNGSHTGVDCNQCHSGGYAGTPSSCEGCHLSDYTAAATPNHVDAGFPTDCAMCHDETAWGNATFDHNTTGFPLTGQHVNADCAQCHSGGYAGTPTSCDACHLSEYTATTDPNHTAAGFPTDCALCHDATAWTNATFDHSGTSFPLMGAHAAAACAQCHSGGYTGTPTNCDACHIADYNGANDPNHSSEQLPLDCAQCHGQNSWTPTTYDHDADYFRIYSGTHSEAWNACSDCHITPGDLSVFSCTVCHDNVAQLANDHSAVSGYAYDSNACYGCHPQGN